MSSQLSKLQGSPASRLSELTEQGLWTNQTLHGLLAASVAASPAALAVADQPNKHDLTGTNALRLTYAQLDIASDNLALTLLANNIGHGDIILVQLPNSVELVTCYFAASKIGAVISPIPVQYSRHELSTIQSAVQPALGISCSNLSGNNLASQMDECISASVIAFGNGASDSQLDLNLNSKAACIITQHQYAIDSESHNGSDENFDSKIDGNTVITLCWTSGTTGTPKGVPRTHNMWVATSNVIIESAKLQSGDTLLNPFPLVNMAAIAGFLYPCAQLGLTLTLHHPIDIPVFLSQLENEKINFTIIPPALLNQLAKKPEMWNQFDFSNLRCIGSGSAPLSPWMIETFKTAYGKDIINFYGSNEGISLINTADVTDDSEIRATMFPRFGAANTPWQGTCHQLVRSKVADTETGNEILEPGKPGELMFAGATIFDGYYAAKNDPDQTIDNSTVFDSDGYFHTGDLVEICSEAPNFYRIVGRCKDIINRGGMKISPTEIDILLEGFSGLAEAAVCAYNDETMGEKICACLVLAPDSPTPTIEILGDYLLGQGLAKFKLPEKIQLFTQLPRNPMGKVLRGELEHIVKNAN
ncbi:MAG: cyclohexanecarboxylate-CoA ligase [Pseudomonadales bacterium]|jgi:cyclohexanecarboxylate-CoA ligase